MLARIPVHFKIAFIVLLWGGVVLALHLLSFDSYGINEAAARALLLNWSVADGVVNPIVVFGLPDLRVLLFAPLGIYWAGSIAAVKIFTLLIAFSATLMFYRWARRTMSEEVALIGSGLLLIAPLNFSQINAVGTGPYLLLLFALGQWLDQKYRTVQRHLGGWYFLQLTLAAVAVSLHPAGLAYPFSIIWEWRKNPINKQHRTHIIAGLLITTTVILIMRLGWPAMDWGNNPLTQLSHLVFSASPDSAAQSWMVGLVPAIFLAILLLSEFRRLFDDLLGRMLLGGLLLGAVAADPGWAMLALVIFLYNGVDKLIKINQSWSAGGLLGQRGLVLTVIFAAATVYMIADKTQRFNIMQGALAPEDEVIRTLTGELEDRKEPTATISQWPARTLLATRQSAFPLPPPAQDAQGLLKNLQGAHFLLFNPYDTKNSDLTRQVSELSNQLKTIMVMPNCVLIEIENSSRKNEAPASHP